MNTIRNVNEKREVHDALEDVARKAFGNIPFEGGGSTDEWFYRSYIATGNWNYRGTPYYYGKPMKFFHLTGLSNVFSIINSRCFRMYDLNSSEDESEYSYAAKAMGLSDSLITNAKRRLYTMSFCPMTELQNPFVWGKYGKGGAAIAFEVINDPARWYDMNCAQIMYSLPPEINHYQDDLREVMRKYNISHVEMDMSRLLGFFKKDHLIDEREVRFLRQPPYRSYQEDIKFIKRDYRFDKSLKRNRLTTYIELPLWVDNNGIEFFEPNGINPRLSMKVDIDDNYFVKNPQIKITDVLVWNECGLEESDFKVVRDELELTIRTHLGYSVSISRQFFTLK